MHSSHKKIKYLYKIGKFQDQALIKINIASIVCKSQYKIHLSALAISICIIGDLGTLWKHGTVFLAVYI